MSVLITPAVSLGTHARSVALLAGAVCRVLLLDDEHARAVERAALWHDVGKLTIPAEILQRPGPLDAREWEVVRRHPVLGEAVVVAVSPDAEIAALVRHHHERWDGTGYPDGLAGERIPLGARIIAACDTFDAMIGERPYRPVSSVMRALGEIAAVAGTQLDPEVAAALVIAVGQTRGWSHA